MKATTRLTDYNSSIDLCYRLSAAQVDRFLDNIVPKVDLARTESLIRASGPDADP
jgi:hypothetical protein